AGGRLGARLAPHGCICWHCRVCESVARARLQPRRRCTMARRAWLLAVLCFIAIGPNFLGAYTLSDKFGININTGSPSVVYSASLAAQARFGWVRLFVSWLATEPSQGVYDFSTLDPSVSAALAQGLQVDFAIDTIPLWANGAPSTCTGAACAIPP